MKTLNALRQDALNSGILIVEDDYLGRVVLQEMFKRQGFHRLEEATNGREALEKIEKLRPGLVILDVLMPEMDGIECCRRIRASSDPEIAGVPILFQTVMDGMEDKVRMFEAGATDYLTKPADPHEIVARAFVHLERELMTRRLREHSARLTQELELARMSQQVLVPDEKALESILERYQLSIQSYYQPSSELGGDFWGINPLSDNELALYMVDFSGHGVNAALNVFRLHALMQSVNESAADPGAYLSQLNRQLNAILPTGQFATMFYGVINKQERTLCYASAAAPPPVIFRGDTRHAFSLLEGSGGLLGVTKNAVFETITLPMKQGDHLLCYSDALIETQDADGKMREVEAWAERCQHALQRGEGGDAAFNGLLKDFQQCYEPNIEDDLTLALFCQES